MKSKRLDLVIMSGKGKLWRAMILVLILPALTLSACGKADQAEEGTSAVANPEGVNQKPAQPQEKLLNLDADEARKAGIKVEKLQWRKKNDQITVTATIEPNQNRLVRIAPRASGRITEVKADFGDSARQGQTLALLNSIELGGALSVYFQAQSDFELAEANLERAKRLLKDQIIPQMDYLRARAIFANSETTLRAAVDKLRMLDVDPASAAADDSSLAVFPVVAPFAGTVIAKTAVTGGLARADQALFTVADLSTLWIEADLVEKDLSEAKIGALSTVSVAAYPNERFEGRLTYISSTMNPQSRTVKARVEAPNPDGKLKPGMFAIVAIDTGAGGKALMVPEVAVTLMQDTPTVFVAEKDGFAPRPVEVGARFAGKAVIKSGLAAGERVVMSGAYSLKARILKSQIGETD
ncbi:MAG: efflux RND transporter periplasmic adaptor subunit [Gammaproteobacteria bacterium]|nr:efflux RND transporter periplasmic adaptor subunit [Gammaproteobacteria bacterium]